MNKEDDGEMDAINMLSLDDLDEVRGGCFSGTYLTEALDLV